MSGKEFSVGSFVGHYGCPDCGSSDNLCVYQKPVEDSDEVYFDATCQTPSCGFKSSEWLEEHNIISGGKAIVKPKAPFRMTDELYKSLMDIKSMGSIHGWRSRNVDPKTDEFYGVCTTYENNKVKFRYYPSTKDGKLVGYHVRNNPLKQAIKKAKKEGSEKPKGAAFFPVGLCKVETELFGQSLFNKGGRHLIIANGEEGALAIFKAVDAEKYGTAVVSSMIGEGNAAKQIKSNYEFVSSFEKVTIVFDNDPTGIAGAEEVAKLLKPSQAFIAKLKKGDPNDYLRAGLLEELKRQILWEAEQYTPVGVYALSSLWDSFQNSTSNDLIPFPDEFGQLNKMMGGGRERGEITCIGAFTSIGKSTIISHSVYHLLKHTKYKVGAMYLEGTQREVVRDLLSIDVERNLKHARPEDLNMEELRQAFMTGIAKNDNFVFVDSQGALTLDDMFDKLNYLAKGCGCDVLIIDPIQAAIASDSNSATIEFMDRLLKLAKQTNCAIDIVSHMKKPDNNDPHDVTEYSLLGSSSINQISFNTILASRDKMSEDDDKKNWTQLKLVKCRRMGLTGSAGGFKYDNKTTLIKAAPSPYGGDSIDFEEDFLVDEDVVEAVEVTSVKENVIEEQDEWVVNKPD